MKNSLKWGALCLCAYLIFLLVKLPAAQVFGYLSLPPQVKLQGIKGTVWQGQAASATVQGLPLNNVKWTLDFWPLLVGNISARVNAGNIRQTEDIALSGDLVLTSERLQLEGAQAYLPTSLMMSILPLPFPVKAEGRFKLDITELDYGQSCFVLQGKGQWLNAKVEGLEGMIDLGNFSADIACENNQVILTVNEPNIFALSARASIAANFNFQVNGKFKPDASLPEEVHQAAQFFGAQDAQGYYQIKF